MTTEKRRRGNFNVTILILSGVAVLAACLACIGIYAASGSRTPMPTRPPDTLEPSPSETDRAQELLGPTATTGLTTATTAAPTNAATVLATNTNTRTASATATRQPTNTAPRPTNTTAPTQPLTDTAVPTQPPPPTDTPPPQGTNYDNNGDGRVTCADFSTQAQAQEAYNAGHTNLDGNDNDGLACESLP